MPPAFVLGQKTGNIAPIKYQKSATDKDKWIELERRRWTRLFSIPMGESLPEGFPPLTLSMMRTLCALTILDSDQEKLCRALDALYKAFWVDLKPTQEPEVMVEVLMQVLGDEETRKIVEISKKEGKDLLLKNTDKAFDDGAFGLPWFTCTNGEGETEGFWGVDHLGQVVDFLGLERPKMGGWKALL